MPRLSKIGAAALAAFGWTSGSSVTASYLVVAGGGGGGSGESSRAGGGGGAGGLLSGTATLNPTLSYTVTVGAGGVGGVDVTSNSNTSGSNSVFNAVTSTGGGAGGTTGTLAGQNGGSGGGGSNGSAAGTGVSGQGSAGGVGQSAGNSYGGGGGGASAVGTNGSSGVGGTGGAGTASSITGSSVTYAGGGGGGLEGTGTQGAGGAGGGGTGNNGTGTNAASGTANLGGGGGGAGKGTSGAAVNGGKGGSGVVIISYVGAQQFGGGNVTSSGGNTIHTFTTSGTLSPLSSLTAQYLIVAGGGGGNGAVNDYTLAGGGGAGGLLTGTGVTIDTNSNYVVTVGAGGTGLVYTQAGSAGNGGNSSWSIVSTTAIGGGGGASFATQAGNGGSGGGAGATYPTGGTGTSGQGNNGGTATVFSGKGAGGGGGASAVGGNATTNTGGAGGAGTASSISGSSVTYAGGGGGAGASVGGAGGSGGGGAGAVYNNDGSAGTAFTGGGGGGAARNNAAGQQTGGNGGSGVVIIAYPGATQQMAGGTVTISGGNVIHTFTSSGYLTPIKYASRSLRFRSSASAYLNRTFKTPTSGSIWTYSTWVKRGILGSSNQQLLSAGASVSDQIYFQGGSTDKLIVYLSGSQTTTQVFRDPSAWYHIVISVDTTQATNTNRLKLYVNGSQVTAFDATSYPTQNSTTKINSAVDHYISRYAASAGDYIDGYLTEINFIDGQQLTPSSFGTFNSYGVWQPITYGGSYGTNGFYLTFGDNTSTTTLGYDTSPQGNNWTTNNISVTAGATYDSMTDVPTLTSATVANYATWNPLWFIGSSTFSSANLIASCPANNGVYTTIPLTTGKWYAEVTPSGGVVGIGVNASDGYIPTSGGSFGYNNGDYSYLYSGNKMVNNGTQTAYGASYTTNDIIGIAIDADAGTVTLYKNNSSQGAIVTGLTGKKWVVAACSLTGTFNITLNNGAGSGFTYTPPSGYLAMNTYNLSTPTIPNGAAYFAATTYTGDGATKPSSQSISNSVNGTSFQPDFVWIKSRSNAYGNFVWDVIRGVANDAYLQTDSANAQNSDATGNQMSSFNSNGFSVQNTTGGSVGTNNSGSTFVGWQWKANGTGVSNTSGTITSTVSANTTAGFSIATYSGNGTSGATVGHGLGVAPSMYIVKCRTQGAGYNWAVYHASLGATQYLGLNTTNAAATASTVWNNTAPTSSVFSLGNDLAINSGTQTYVAYCFAAVAGYSAFGSYTGNGSSDGPFIYTGFRPRFVLVKHTNDVNSWFVWDSSRNSYNAANLTLKPNSSDAEETLYSIDALSNGFKIRTSDVRQNTSGGTYIYAAFAENPFKYSLAR